MHIDDIITVSSKVHKYTRWILLEIINFWSKYLSKLTIVVIPIVLQLHEELLPLIDVVFKFDNWRQFSCPHDANQMAIDAQMINVIECKINGKIGKNSELIMWPRALKYSIIYQDVIIFCNLNNFIDKFYLLLSVINAIAIRIREQMMKNMTKNINSTIADIIPNNSNNYLNSLLLYFNLFTKCQPCIGHFKIK